MLNVKATYNPTKNGSQCEKVGCHFLDDIAALGTWHSARIPLGLLLLQRGVLLLLELLDAKGFVGLPFLPLFKDDAQKIKTDALSSGIVCFVSVALGLLVLWVAGDIVISK